MTIPDFDYPFSQTGLAVPDSFSQAMQRAADGLLYLVSWGSGTAWPDNPYPRQRFYRTDLGYVGLYDDVAEEWVPWTAPIAMLRQHVAVLPWVASCSASFGVYVPTCLETRVLESLIVTSSTGTVGSGGSTKWNFNVRNLTDSVNLAAADLTTDGAELVADTPATLTLDQNLTVESGDVLQVKVTKTGSPTTLTDLQLELVWRLRG